MDAVPDHDFTRRLTAVAAEAESALEGLLGNDTLPSEVLRPPRLMEAMRYAVLGGGKRLRPLLVYATGLAFGAPPERLDTAAAAVEIIHAYSLVHDDLPAMDDE